jgi:ABC-type nitrate/sulfonate/bicarbonate transport system substrate-binding protein
MKSILKIFYTIIIPLIILAALGYFALRWDSPKAQTKTNKIIISSDYEALKDIDLLVNTAIEQGYFRDAGVEVEKKNSLVNSLSLSKGESDIAVYPVPIAMDSFYNNEDFRWIATTNNYLSSNYLVSRYPSTELSKVKKVGIMKLGNFEQAVMPSILKKLGHEDTQGIEYIVAPDNQIKTDKFEKNEIDIALIFSNPDTKKLEALNKYTIFKPSEILDNTNAMPVGLITTKKALANRAKEVEGVVRAIHKAIGYLSDNKNIAIEKIADKYNYTQEESQSIYYEIVESRKGLNYVPGSQDIEAMSQFIKVKSAAKSPNRNLADFIFTDYARLVTEK